MNSQPPSSAPTDAAESRIGIVADTGIDIGTGIGAGEVRTYRGRTLQELIPQIKADLGPGAIILREREGVTGGVGGFFAQRCVEIDAQAAPRVSVYADDLDDELDEELEEELEEEEEETNGEPQASPAEPALSEPILSEPILSERTFSEAGFDEATFAARLEQAALAQNEPPAFIAFDELAAPEPQPEAVAAPEVVAEPEPVSTGPFIATPLEIPVPVAIDPPPAPMAIEPPAAPAVTVAVEPPPSPEPPPATPVTSPVPPAPAMTSPVPPVPAVASPVAAPPPVLKRRRGGLAERMVRAAQAARSAAMEMQSATPAPPAAAPVPAATTPAPAPNQTAPVRPAPTEELQRRLLDAGLSRTRAHELIGAALEITEDDELLTHAVRHELISALPAPTPLPSGGGVIAVVGAGGSGKTRCVAALAVACARAGLRPVSVAHLGTPARATELAELVAGENISVIPAMRTRATVRAVSSAGERGLVILDTPAASPGGTSAVEVLGDALAQFELDAIYLAVPATITARAAARLTEGFAPLGLEGLIATHVDEADQLGVVAELSMQTELPISHTHAGVDVTTALKPTDPDRIAEVLFP